MKHKHRHRKLHIHKRAPAGAPPGTLSVDPCAPQPVVRIFAYGPAECVEREIKDVAEIRQWIGKLPVLWINVDALGDVRIIEQIGEIFGLHGLALEDVVNTHQRAKVDVFEDRLFVVAHMVEYQEHLESEQVSLFLGQRVVVTFQERPGDCLDPVRKRIREGVGRIRKSGPDYLAYALLDAIIDSYYPTLEHYGDLIDVLEDELLAGHASDGMRKVHAMKRELLVLRRLIWPHREAMALLSRDDSPLIEPATRLFFRDTYDHVVQLVDLVETFRELAADLRDFHMTAVSNRINETMRVLTVIATIFIPITFIASIYGMNFDPSSPYNMPELKWPYGYYACLGSMALVTIGMLVYFYRQGWLRWSSGAEEAGEV